MTRDELILRTRQLIAEGERLDADPSLNSLQTWLQLSDDLLATAWGTMDRYHLAWLMVGKPKGIVRGREMTADEAGAYVREVASAKTAALRMSLDAVERQRMPFRGESGGFGAGQGMGTVPNAKAGEAESDEAGEAQAGEAGRSASGAEPADDDAGRTRHAGADEATGRITDAAARPQPSRNRQIPLDPEMAARLEEVRRAAAEHAAHERTAAPETPAQRRAPRPERLQH